MTLAGRRHNRKGETPTAHGAGVRRARRGLAGVLLMLLAQASGAAENCFPRGKSVTFVIPYAIGGLENFYGRMMKTVAEEAIGSQFNTKNVPAKGGIDGMKELYGARPSGRTLGILNAADAVVAGLVDAVPFEISQFSIFGRIVDTPRAIYVGKSARAKGITSLADARGTGQTLRWGITGPSNFFAAAVLNHLLGTRGTFTRIRGSTREGAEAADRGDVDLVVLDIQSASTIASADILPILALGPSVPQERAFEKYKVPMAGQIVKGPDAEKALSVARITASGLIVAGPPHIPGIREKCIQAGFQKALAGPNLRALARTTGKPVAPLDSSATIKLVRDVASGATPFKAIWVEALKSIAN